MRRFVVAEVVKKVHVLDLTLLVCCLIQLIKSHLRFQWLGSLTIWGMAKIAGSSCNLICVQRECMLFPMWSLNPSQKSPMLCPPGQLPGTHREDRILAASHNTESKEEADLVGTKNVSFRITGTISIEAIFFSFPWNFLSSPSPPPPRINTFLWAAVFHINRSVSTGTEDQLEEKRPLDNKSLHSRHIQPRRFFPPLWKT